MVMLLIAILLMLVLLLILIPCLLLSWLAKLSFSQPLYILLILSFLYSLIKLSNLLLDCLTDSDIEKDSDSFNICSNFFFLQEYNL